MSVQDEFVFLMFGERRYQEEHWTNANDDTHTGLEWGGLLARYVGRIVEAALTSNRFLYRKALVVLASVALAAYEADFRRSESFLRDDPTATLPEGAPHNVLRES